MIDITVKTLDSQNHTFFLADDITVRGFKEHIAERVNVPANSQRLIYCGRVLQDEKHLSEYDCNGKVIHLVQRAPPQSAQRSGAGSQQQGQNQNRNDQPQSQRMHYHQAQTRIHGNPMYLGSFSIPAEVVENQGWLMTQLSDTLSNSRLAVASQMLNQANRVLLRLENMTSTATNETTASSERDEAASDAQGTASTESDRFMQRFYWGTVPIIEITRAIVGSGRPPNRSPMRGSGAGEAEAENATPPTETTNSESQAQTQETQETQTPRSGDTNAEADGSENTRSNTRFGLPRTRIDRRSGTLRMAQLLARLVGMQDRLRPFIIRNRMFLTRDPQIPSNMSFGVNIGTVEENQRIADGVAECLHFFAHANHALSDLNIDVGQQPPRNLRCRPVLIQHSAILQAGIPIQVEAHISVARNDGTNDESGEEGGETANRPPTSITVTRPTWPNPIDLTLVTGQGEAAPPTPGQTQPEQQQQEPQPQPQQAQNQPPVDSPFGAIFNITNNVEVVMEMASPENDGSQTADGGNAGFEQSQPNAGNNNNNNSNNNNAPGAGGVAGMFPWGPAAPHSEVMRNLMHVVAGYIAQSAATDSTVPTTTSTSTPTTCIRQRVQVGVGSGAAPNPGQSTQARSNVGTHPTTSTQTRSTARPHVFHANAHPLGVGMGMGQSMNFDPFLPCNSHHIRRTPSATPTNSAATTSPQQTAQTSQSTTPNGTGQTQPEVPSASTERSSTQLPTDQSRATADLKDEIESEVPSASAERSSSQLPTDQSRATVNLKNEIESEVPSASAERSSTQLPTDQSRATVDLKNEIESEVPSASAERSSTQMPTNPNRARISLKSEIESLCSVARGEPEDPCDGAPLSSSTFEDLLFSRGIQCNIVNNGEPSLFLQHMFNACSKIEVTEWYAYLTNGNFTLNHHVWFILNSNITNAFAVLARQWNTRIGSGMTEHIIRELQSYYYDAFDAEERQPLLIEKDAIIDLPAIIDAILHTYITRLESWIHQCRHQGAWCVAWGNGVVLILSEMGRKLVNVLVSSLRRKQDGLDSVIRFIATRVMEGQHSELRDWVLGSVVDWLCAYCRTIEPLPTATVDSMIVTKKYDASKYGLPKPEPMEASGNSQWKQRRPVGDPLDVDDEEIPTTFPGHEALLPEWVPIIARDGIRQRRQLQLQGGAVTTLSDAYLDGLPSKRRKLVGQQKSQLLVTPIPNHGSLTASLKRLVRENVVRAGIKVVDGASAAVASDPEVRRAFGEAIREYVNPQKLQTPDFPNSHRFPNATKFFADKNASMK